MPHVEHRPSGRFASNSRGPPQFGQSFGGRSALLAGGRRAFRPPMESPPLSLSLLKRVAVDVGDDNAPANAGASAITLKPTAASWRTRDPDDYGWESIN